MSVNIFKEEFNSDIAINLREFRIADWWANEYKIHRSEAISDLSNAIAIIIFINPQTPDGAYEIEIDSIEAVGLWILDFGEYTYLTILIIWSIFFSFLGAAWISKMHQRIKRAEHSVSSLTKDALTDTLTQTYNRRGLDLIIENLLHSEASYAVLVFDIDHFKKVNDTYGHNAGDAVIVEIAKRIKSSAREGDNLARWGGKEFVLISQNTSIEGAMILADKIRKAIG